MGIGNNPRGDEAVGISAAFSVVGNLVVFSRLYIRFFLIKRPGAEDFFIAIAMLFSTTFTILIKVQANAGLGMHVWELTNEELLGPLKSLFASIICYYFAFAFTKASILFQYYRLFRESRARYAIYILSTFVFLFSIETILATIFLCVPVQKFWEPSIPGSCANKRVLWFTNSAIHIATDFAIVILPMPVLQQLKLPYKQKRALVLVFAMGGLACAVSIARLHSLVKITSSNDLTYDNANTATWSTGELNISLICSCLPALRPIAMRLLPNIFATSTRSNARDQSQYGLQIPDGGARRSRQFKASGNRFGGSELTIETRGACDDELPLHSKCWAHGRQEEYEMIGDSREVGNAQILVVTNIQQQVQNQRSDELVYGGGLQVKGPE